jgi:hypothetical protein
VLCFKDIVNPPVRPIASIPPDTPTEIPPLIGESSSYGNGYGSRYGSAYDEDKFEVTISTKRMSEPTFWEWLNRPEQSGILLFFVVFGALAFICVICNMARVQGELEAKTSLIRNQQQQEMMTEAFIEAQRRIKEEESKTNSIS